MFCIESVGKSERIDITDPRTAVEWRPLGGKSEVGIPHHKVVDETDKHRVDRSASCIFHLEAEDDEEIRAWIFPGIGLLVYRNVQRYMPDEFLTRTRIYSVRIGVVGNKILVTYCRGGIIPRLEERAPFCQAAVQRLCELRRVTVVIRRYCTDERSLTVLISTDPKSTAEEVFDLGSYRGDRIFARRLRRPERLIEGVADTTEARNGKPDVADTGRTVIRYLTLCYCVYT